MTRSKLVSVNVGLPRPASWRAESAVTGIFKAPVAGPLMLRAENLEGDAQADLSVHGGRNKAAYAYASEHYAWWRGKFPDMEMPWGTFGENFTTGGLDETTVHAGDRLRIGGAVVVVTQPRLPCFKLGIRFRRRDMPRIFLASGRTGFYMRVEEEGEVRAGDAVELLGAEEHAVSIADLLRLRADGARDRALLERALLVDALPGSWKRSLLEESGGESAGD